MANFVPMFLPVLVTFMMINVCLGDISSRTPPPVGGIEPVDPKDPAIVKLGKFAVSEYDKKVQGDLILTYKNVVKADKQVVTGLKYRLTIEAQNGTKSTDSYNAEVWENPAKHVRTLVSFVAAKKELF